MEKTQYRAIKAIGPDVNWRYKFYNIYYVWILTVRISIMKNLKPYSYKKIKRKKVKNTNRIK